MTEIYQYGIPGMKWGVRRSEKQLARDARNTERDATAKKNYSTKQRNADTEWAGKRGTKRIAKRVGKGRSVTAARNMETGRQMAVGILGSLAVSAAPAVALSGIVAAEKGLVGRVNKQNAAFAKAGQEAAAAIFSDSRGLTNLNTISLNPSEYTRTS